MKIAIGADHRGTDVLARLCDLLAKEGCEVVNLGPADPRGCDYPDVAFQVANVVKNGEANLGVLVCGTGIGMSITANKIDGIRAALVHDEIGADMSRRHNNANILCLSADMLGQRIIDRIVLTWLKTPFEGGRHERRNRKVAAIEQGQDPRTVTEPSNNNSSPSIGDDDSTIGFR